MKRAVIIFAQLVFMVIGILSFAIADGNAQMISVSETIFPAPQPTPSPRNYLELEAYYKYKEFLKSQNNMAPQALCTRLPIALAEDAEEVNPILINAATAAAKKAWALRCFKEVGAAPYSGLISSLQSVSGHAIECGSQGFGREADNLNCVIQANPVHPLIMNIELVAETSGGVGFSIDRGRFLNVPTATNAGCEVLRQERFVFLGFCLVVN